MSRSHIVGLLTVVALLVSCGGPSEQAYIADVVRQPDQYVGKRIAILAYYSSKYRQLQSGVEDRVAVDVATVKGFWRRLALGSSGFVQITGTLVYTPGGNE